MKWLAGLFILFLILVIVAADQERLPGFVVALYAFPGGDKAGHFLLSGGLSFLVGVALTSGCARPTSRRVVMGGIVIAALVTPEEVSQALFRSRTSAWGDAASSYAGIVFFSTLASLIRRQRK